LTSGSSSGVEPPPAASAAQARIASRTVDPDDSYPSPERYGWDREIRWRRYDEQVVKVVVDVADGSIVSVWTTQVKP
jgi:hypothetical protein